MSRKKTAQGILVMLLVAVTTTVAYTSLSTDKESNDTVVTVPAVAGASTQPTASLRYYDEGTKLSFEYAPELISRELTEEERAQGEVIGYITPDVESSAPFIVTIKREEGFQSLSALAGQDATEVILSNVNRSYPIQFIGFDVIRQRTLTLADVNAVETVFTYDSPSGGSVQQHFVGLMRTRDEAVFVSFQALKKDFDALSTQYFDTILQSLSFE